MGLVYGVTLDEPYTCLSKKRTHQTCNQAPCVAKYVANMGLVTRVILGELYTCLPKKTAPQTCNQAPCVAVTANMDLVTRVIWTSSTYLPGVSKVSFEFETILN